MLFLPPSNSYASTQSKVVKAFVGNPRRSRLFGFGGRSRSSKRARQGLVWRREVENYKTNATKRESLPMPLFKLRLTKATLSQIALGGVVQTRVLAECVSLRLLLHHEQWVHIARVSDRQEGILTCTAFLPAKEVRVAFVGATPLTFCALARFSFLCKCISIHGFCVSCRSGAGSRLQLPRLEWPFMEFMLLWSVARGV